MPTRAQRFEFVTKLCQMCGTKFKTKQPTRAKFCSAACRSRWRRIHMRWSKWRETEEGKRYMSTPCEEYENQ